MQKSNFKIPFVCGARNLGEALRRINEVCARVAGERERAFKHKCNDTLIHRANTHVPRHHSGRIKTATNRQADTLILSPSLSLLLSVYLSLSLSLSLSLFVSVSLSPCAFAQGAVMIRTKGAAGTGDVVQAVQHVRTIAEEINALKGMDENDLRKVHRERERGGGETDRQREKERRREGHRVCVCLSVCHTHTHTHTQPALVDLYFVVGSRLLQRSVCHWNLSSKRVSLAGSLW